MYTNLNTKVDTLNVDVENAIEFIFCDINSGLVLIRGSSIIDDDVEAAELRHSGVEKFLPVWLKGHVGGHGNDAWRRGRAESFLKSVGIEVAGYDWAAVASEEFGYGETEPRRGTFGRKYVSLC